MRPFRSLWARESPAHPVSKPMCHCLDSQYGEMPWSELQIHTERQNVECAGWQRLNELIDQAASDGRAEFSPGTEMSPGEWAQITELPKTISKLKRVKRFILYGSESETTGLGSG